MTMQTTLFTVATHRYKYVVAHDSNILEESKMFPAFNCQYNEYEV